MSELVSMFEIACLDIEAGKFDTAENKLREIIELEPDNYEAINKLGVVYANKRDFITAEELFLRVLDISHDYSPAMVNLGNLSQECGDADCALDYYKAATETDPENCLAHYNLAILYKRKNNLDKYIKHMKNYKRFYKRQLENERLAINQGKKEGKHFGAFFLLAIFALFTIFYVLTYWRS